MAQRSNMLKILISLLICHLSVNAAKLSQPKVLLPYYSTAATSYQLEIHDAKGCYQWRSSRPEVAVVKENGDPTCSHSVVVTATSRSPNRMTAVLLAESKETGDVLRCDVIVDSIASIGIETTTRELYLDDSPEKFQMVATDAEGNTFSSLTSTTFEWSLVTDEGDGDDLVVEAHNILKIVTYRDSQYDTPEHIESLEAKGLQGDTILVEGVRSGSAYVNVRVSDLAYKNVDAVQVRLIVIANVILQPVDSYILLHSKLRYRAHVIKQGVLHEIKLPSENYQLEVEDNTICRLSKGRSEVIGLAIGDTDVKLRDLNMPAKLLNAIHRPTATVHVVYPAFIGFSIQPANRWVLEVERIYEVTVELYDKHRHRIHITDNMWLDTYFDNSLFKVIQSSSNGSYHIVQPLNIGHTEIEAELKHIVDENGQKHMITPVVRGSQPLDIFHRLSILPYRLVFPWVPQDGASFQANVKANGGSGEFSWLSNDSTIAEVQAKGSIGLVTTHNKIGESEIRAIDHRNDLHTASAQVIVLPPEHMKFVPITVEAEVGTIIKLPLKITAQYNHERIAFTDCTQLTMEVSSKSDSFTYLSDERPDLSSRSAEDYNSSELPCTHIVLSALKKGHSVITATYKRGNVNLVAEITVAAFDPLVPVDPVEYAVLAQNTMRELVFQGGPLPWILDPSMYFETAGVENANKAVRLHSVKANGYLHKVYAECLQLGDHVITMEVGNKPTSSNMLPAKRQTSVKVFCERPSNVQLTPLIPRPTGLPPCPISLDNNDGNVNIPAHNYLPLDIQLTVTDRRGRVFDNISSFSTHWMLSDSHLGNMPKKSVKYRTTKLENKATRALWYQTLEPKKQVGDIKVSLKLESIEKELMLTLVNDAIIEPSNIVIFNHPDSSASASVVGGSRYFTTSQSPEGLCTVEYNDQAHSLRIIPHRDGSIRLGVKDLCLTSQKEAVADVRIAEAKTVKLTVRDKVQLDNSLTATVQVLDHTGKPMPARYFDMVSLKPSLDPESQRCVRLTQLDNLDSETASYRVDGAMLGTAHLVFTVRSPSKALIRSERKPVQVFPPLRLEPRNVTLIVGATIQVQATGGPQPQSTIEYSVTKGSTDIATISGSGLVNASSVGSVTIRAQAVGVDDETGERVVFSEDRGEIHVVKLAGIRIFTPLTRLQSNTKMPVYVMGLSDHETPFSFANVYPPLNFEWSITNSEVACLQSAYYKSNIYMPPESSFSNQLHTHQEGHVTIKVKVSATVNGYHKTEQLVGNRILIDEAHIQVFDNLKLVTPTECSNLLLITPNTAAKLKTNRDTTAKMSYSLVEDTDLLTLSNNGEIQTGSRAGSTGILVTSIESFGLNQTVLLHVKIKPVSYIMLTCETDIHTAAPLQFIPVGATVEFRVSHHDESGQVFDFTNSQLKFRPNRYDLLQIMPGSGNDTVTVKVPQVSPYSWGGTALKVWDVNQPRVRDYVNINVQKAIASQAEYNVGDVICLSSQLLTPSGATGTWNSESPALFNVRPDNGQALALAPGSNTISYSLSSSLSTYAQVNIKPVDQLSLQQTEHVKHFIPSEGQKLSLPVIINSQKKTTCRGISRLSDSYPFECHVTSSLDHHFTQENSNDAVDKVVMAAPTWDQDKGIYACVVTCTAELSSDTKLKLSRLEGTISVTATANSVSSNSIDVTFLPPPVVNTKELYVSPKEGSYIDVSATSHTIQYVSVKVDGRLASVLAAGSPVKYDLGYRIPISATSSNAMAFDGNLLVVDRLADSTYEIPVHVAAGNHTQGRSIARLGSILWGNTDLLVFLAACVIVSTICLFLGYFAVFNRVPPPPRDVSVCGDNSVLSNSSSSPKFGSPSHSPIAGGDIFSSPQHNQRPAGRRSALWSSGYGPQEANQPDISLFKRSPSRLSGHQ